MGKGNIIINTSYSDFLKTKENRFTRAGFDIEIEFINPLLFEWQRHIVKWALRKGKCATFADCGLGKTAIQLEYAQKVHEHTNEPVLILAPLAVSKQTKREGDKFNIPVNICKTQDDVINGVNITNYEKIEHFDCSVFSGIVLDESSILKGVGSKTKQLLTDKFLLTPFKLCCTATPSPNDYMEIGNHCDFLGIMSRSEMLATYFVHDMNDTQKWRLKGHAQVKFWEWLASWSIVMKTPEDIGFMDCKGYDLPKLNMFNNIVESVVERSEDEQISLFKTTAKTLTERRIARKDSLSERVLKVQEIINNNPDEIFIVWCDFNIESEMLKKTIEGSVEVKGADKPEHKEKSAIDFADGKIKTLISKSSIFGYGLNWQKCHNIIFCGLSDSFEQFYQAIRRCWRFGQINEVNVYIVISERELEILNNINRKESDMQRMQAEMIKLTKDSVISDMHNTIRITERYIAEQDIIIPAWLEGEVI